MCDHYYTVNAYVGVLFIYMIAQTYITTYVKYVP